MADRAIDIGEARLRRTVKRAVEAIRDRRYDQVFPARRQGRAVEDNRSLPAPKGSYRGAAAPGNPKGRPAGNATTPHDGPSTAPGGSRAVDPAAGLETYLPDRAPFGAAHVEGRRVVVHIVASLNPTAAELFGKQLIEMARVARGGGDAG